MKCKKEIQLLDTNLLGVNAMSTPTSKLSTDFWKDKPTSRGQTHFLMWALILVKPLHQKLIEFDLKQKYHLNEQTIQPNLWKWKRVDNYQYLYISSSILYFVLLKSVKLYATFVMMWITLKELNLCLKIMNLKLCLLNQEFVLREMWILLNVKMEMCECVVKLCEDGNLIWVELKCENVMFMLLKIKNTIWTKNTKPCVRQILWREHQNQRKWFRNEWCLERGETTLVSACENAYDDLLGVHKDLGVNQVWAYRE